MTSPINLNSKTAGSVSNSTGKPQNNTDTSIKNESSASTASSEDTVSLSQESKQVSGLQQQLKDSPAVDMAKVETIKQEIANGNYPLDAEKIAQNLINLEHSLLE